MNNRIKLISLKCTFYVLSLWFCASPFLSSAQNLTQFPSLPRELLTPSIVEINRMPMRAHGFGFENVEKARSGEKETSDRFLSLNGTWKFQWVQNPQQRSQGFYETDFDDGAWDDFKVPANWETNGYGLPVYVNHPYEFTGRKVMGGKLNPPFDIPADNNPVGSYRKTFELPANWQGQEVFIHLGAVKSAFFIWVNGKSVGYSTDSKLAAEFDLTEYLKPGTNTIALQVYRWSAGSYLECQDMWRISGIERDVYLYATPKLDIRDFKITGGLDASYQNGTLKALASVQSYKIDSNTLTSVPDTFSMQMSLLDDAGKEIYQSGRVERAVLGRYKQEITVEASIPSVRSWSAETPNLYTLLMHLYDKQGTLLQVIPVKVGFRSVERKGPDLLVNGKRVFFKGVNRHEHHATKGHTLSKADMRKDIEMMKKLNVNAVRNSHYPPDPYFMELCDQYGLYVIDEANIESHGRYYDLAFTFANDPKWREMHLSRIYRMYERDKNFPSVISWSLGNEAGNGINMYEAYEGLKAMDSRPVQYERAGREFNTDVLVPQYPGPEYLKRFSDRPQERGMIMSEYAHIMGNSLGNFKEYWDVIENNPNLQGGYVWEWIDQAIDTVKNGKRILAYGGDFPLEGPVEESFSDNNFSVKGVVTAHRELTPMAVELKKVHQYIKSNYLGNSKLRVFNSYFFRDLSNFFLLWELVKDGTTVQRGSIQDLSLAPRDSSTFDLRLKEPSEKGEYFLNVSYQLKKDEPFLPAGYEQAYEQFALSDPVPPALPGGSSKGTLKLEDGSDRIVLKGKGFQLQFDKKQGRLSTYLRNGDTLMHAGPAPAFWRAPTDNDIGAGYNRKLRDWREVYEQATTSRHSVDQTEQGYSILFEKSLLKGDAKSVIRYQVFPDGRILVEHDFKALKGEHPILMRVGTNLELASRLDQIRFYGRGPWENYWDRKYASSVGLYKQTLEDQYFPYARPQESGNKTDVRWVDLTDKKGKGLRFAFVDSLLNFSALPYSLDDLDPEVDKKQYHSGELELRDRIYMHVDLQQIGLQGIDSWGSKPLPAYRLPFKDYRLTYQIIPLN